MKLEVHLNDKKNGVELHFDKQPGAALFERLVELGFKRSFRDDLKWYSAQHPALVEYARALEKALFEGRDFLSIPMQPSFEPNKANIRANRFSYVIIFFDKGGQTKRDHYVVFDSYKRVATDIATRFGREIYKEAFSGVEVYARNHQIKAGLLMELGKVITGTKDRQAGSPIENPVPLAKPPNPEITNENPRDFFDKANTNGKLQEAMLPGAATREFPNSRKRTAPPMPLLRHYLKSKSNGSNGNHTGSITATVYPWEMTPLQYQKMKAGEKTGHSMTLDDKDSDFHEAAVKQAIIDKKAVPREVLAHYPWLVEKRSKEDKPNQAEMDNTTDKLKKFASFIAKNQVIDGLLYNGELKATFERLGKAALAQLALYLGLKDYQVEFDKGHSGTSGQLVLKGMFTPDKGIRISITRGGVTDEEMEWINKVIMYRSITHPHDTKGGPINILDQKIIATPEMIKEKVYRLLGIQQEEGTGPPVKSKYDYLDRVIGHLHEKYAAGKRPTKTQIEKLGEELGVPNKGMMWEAAELSWLLWYMQLYKEPLPFEMRLEKMVRFWTNLQPTYAYSDSSKELYRQYSTPCPIGAMIAQYTGMDKTKSVFEPSAGNGLLLLGADPGKTHANEIDPTRLASLRIQGFRKITSDNAAGPPDEDMIKAYDVVVSNPPFSRWEEAEVDKEYMVRKYFNGMMGLTRHIRLEHLMAGLALHCMKDDGKAAIIIMGHIYFSDDGYMARYRPFFNWLYRHYMVSDVINLNGFTLYNKQGAIEKTMLILVNGRKPAPEGVAPRQHEAPHLHDIVSSFDALWERIKPHVGYTIDTLIKQLEIELAGRGVIVADS